MSRGPWPRTHRDVVPVDLAALGQRKEGVVRRAGGRAPAEELVDAPDRGPVVVDALPKMRAARVHNLE